jgi:hypothetical protein
MKSVFADHCDADLLLTGHVDLRYLCLEFWSEIRRIYVERWKRRSRDVSGQLESPPYGRVPRPFTRSY